MVSQIIGKQGQQVKILSHISDTSISLKDPVQGFKERVVQIKGKIP
jgi:transcription antitermination factor NusA-like protein